MFGEVTLGISILSLLLSVTAIFRRGRTGMPGPQGVQGIQGERGPQGLPGPQAQPILGAESAVCNTCGKSVARFSLTNTGIVCANCTSSK